MTDDELDLASQTDGTPCITDQTTGEMIPLDDMDGLYEAYARGRSQIAQLQQQNADIAHHLASQTEGEAKTRRLRGKRLRLKIELPDDAWDQAKLKDAWAAYPGYAGMFLRIGRIEPQLREVKKLPNETGGKDFEQFKSMVLGACRGPQGTPKITLEEGL